MKPWIGWIEYINLETNKDGEIHVDLFRDKEYYDSVEGTLILNESVSKATNIPVDNLKVLRIL